MTDALEVRDFTAEQRARADKLLAEINAAIDYATQTHDQLQHSFVRLGLHLSEVKKSQFHLVYGFTSWPRFIADLGERFKKGRTQLYHVVGVAEKLLPSVDADTLEKIGISKALVLKNVVKRTGLPPGQELVDAAADPGTTEKALRRAVTETLGIPDEQRKGKWFEGVEGFYAEPGEIDEIERAFAVADRIDPPLAKDLPDSVRRKERLLRMARSFLAEFEAAIEQE